MPLKIINMTKPAIAIISKLYSRDCFAPATLAMTELNTSLRGANEVSDEAISEIASLATLARNDVIGIMDIKIATRVITGGFEMRLFLSLPGGDLLCVDECLSLSGSRPFA